MAFKIPGIDLNPNGGDSWMGLTRDQAKYLATIFMFTGIFLADPPFSILPTDFVNFWIAGGLVNYFGIQFELALLFTYTCLAWGLILTGIWIYPYDSKRLLSSNINKFKKILKKVLTNPVLLISGLIIFKLMLDWYKGMI